MATMVKSFAIQGIDGYPIDIESATLEGLPTILPMMTEEEPLEVTKIYSISGPLQEGSSLITTRPFRVPHHNASLNALIDGRIIQKNS